MNIVIIEGRLGKDPEVKETANSHVCNMSVATSERRKVDGEWQDFTEWHRVVAWGRTAENCGEYLRKGSRVLIRGDLRTRSWEKDGEKRYATEINAADVTFLDPKQEEPSRGRSERRSPPKSRDDDNGGYLAGDEDPFAKYGGR